MDQRGVG